jgi:hypothetical protein
VRARRALIAARRKLKGTPPMLSSGDQDKACELVDKIRDRNLVRPVVLIRQDQYGTVLLIPVDRNDNKLHTELQIILNDVAITDDYMPQHVIEDLTQLPCWAVDLPIEVSYE